MAQLAADDSGGGKKDKHHKRRAKKGSSTVDMTPMVDLAFLLLTFFVLTATFNKPKAMEINMPVPPKDSTNTTKVKDETAMTILLNDKKDKIFYYYGMFKPETQVEITDYSKDGLRKILLDRNKEVVEKVKKYEEQFRKKQIADSTFKRIINSTEVKGNPDALFVIVKTDEKAKYKSVIDVLDELNICDVGKYAVVDISAPEKALIQDL